MITVEAQGLDTTIDIVEACSSTGATTGRVLRHESKDMKVELDDPHVLVVEEDLVHGRPPARTRGNQSEEALRS